MKSAPHYTMRLRHWISPEFVDGRSALDLYGIWQPGRVIPYNDICGHPITGLGGELHQVPLASQTKCQIGSSSALLAGDSPPKRIRYCAAAAIADSAIDNTCGDSARCLPSSFPSPSRSSDA
jgi:hypothetical protein